MLHYRVTAKPGNVMENGNVMEMSWNFVNFRKCHGNVMEFCFFRRNVMEMSWNFVNSRKKLVKIGINAKIKKIVKV